MPVIDVHTHGVGGYETKGAGPDDIIRIAEIHGSYGIDAVIPTIYSSSIKRMRADIAAVKKAMEMQGSGVGDRGWGRKKSSKPQTKKMKPATILGVHLEGPFLNPVRAGALDAHSFLPARISHYKELIQGFGDIVKIITVAPELKGATGLIKTITDTSVIVSMGHSDATYGEAEAGFNAGAKGITHIFNAMRPVHHREPGIAGFGLTNPHIYVEVIADPFHLHPKTIELIFGAKKPDRIIIVSDSVKAAKKDACTLGVADRAGRLLGGSTPVTESARYLVGLGFPKKIVERCVSVNPERYLAESGLRGIRTICS
ncbi:MAG TPA: hypothetical protein VMT62_02310 [Syntrophorhabdaceae bacterium]|nr:hypothetical protein [Syntrophorhabdaceae bacterium]